MAQRALEIPLGLENRAMNGWNPKSLWRELRQRLDDWMDGDVEGDPEQADDPTLLYHLCFTAPLVLGLILMVRRARRSSLRPRHGASRSRRSRAGATTTA